MPRYFAPITIEELAEKIYDVAKNTSYSYPDPKEWEEEVAKDWDGNTISLTSKKIEQNGHDISWLEMVGNDLKKCSFDTENVQADNEWDDLPNVYGFHTLESGLTFVGVGAGGDWETPITFIVYWDGKKLRGYLPTDGNPWNTDTKEAYGNNEESDKDNFIKRFVISEEDKKVFDEKLANLEVSEYAKPYEPDMLKDINKRILPKPDGEVVEEDTAFVEMPKENPMVAEVRQAYVWIRENNQTIPDEVLDLMKDAAIRELNQ